MSSPPSVTVGFFLFPGIQPLDFVGPWDVFDSWSQFSTTRVHLITFAGTKEPVTSGSGLSFTPSHTVEEVERLSGLSCLVVPGGKGTTAVCRDPKLLGKLAGIMARAESVVTVCTGSFILQAAGELGSSTVATYWRAAQALRELGARVVGRRVVQDGKVWSGGGVTSGLDVSLAYLAATQGRGVAGQIQLRLEYFPDCVLYAEADQVASLPPYREGDSPAELPEYLKTQM